MKTLSQAFQPFGKTSPKVFTIILLVECLVALSVWQALGGGLIPTPSAIFSRFITLLMTADFYDNVIASVWLALKGTSISIAIALIISWLSCIPAFKPSSELIMKFRYLTLSGLIFAFAIMLKEAASIKMAVLLFGIVPFLTTSMLSVVASIPKEEIDLCTTLRMSPWRTLLEVVILGRRDAALDVVRQNFAIAFTMITTVEGISMAAGGLGTMLIRSNKNLDMATIFSVLLSALLFGVLADYLLRVARNFFFPYVK